MTPTVNHALATRYDVEYHDPRYGLPYNLVTKSPCKERPETGEPCPLASKDKNNNVCSICHLVGNNAQTKLHVSEIADMLARDAVDFGGEKLIKNLPVRHAGLSGECVMDDCERPVTKISHIGDFCGRKCYERCYNRLKKWVRDHPGTPPSEQYLYQAIHPGKVRPDRKPDVPNTECQMTGCNERAELIHQRTGFAVCYDHAKLVRRRIRDGMRREIEITDDWLLRAVTKSGRPKI